MLSLVYPYYNNPGMLAIQLRHWRNLLPTMWGDMEVVIVDDGSLTEPAEPVVRARPSGGPPVRLYRITEDRPWHQHGARNLGALVAHGTWLLMCDMDHVVPEATLEYILYSKLRWRTLYKFARVNAPTMEPHKGPDGELRRHPNVFAIMREMFWKVGGYDEDYCGVYGTDSMFLTRAATRLDTVVLENHPIVRYSREYQPDASTRTLPRKEGRAPGAKKEVTLRKKREGRENVIRVLDFPWERVL